MSAFRKTCIGLTVLSFFVAFIGLNELPVLAAFAFSGWLSLFSE